MRPFRKLAGIGLALAAASGCGSDSNFNKIWGQDDGADSRLAAARVAYDEGNFGKAERLAAKLLEINPDNEAAAVLLGYVHLSRSGIDPYQLARRLTCVSTPSQSGCEDESSAVAQLRAHTIDELDSTLERLALPSPSAKLTQQEKEEKEEKEESASNATTTLKKLGSLLAISAEEMTTKLTHGEICSYLAAHDQKCHSDLFTQDRPILVPHAVTSELRSAVNALSHLDRSLTYICRFVDKSVFKVSDVDVDERYVTSGCLDQAKGFRRHATKAHFLFAFTHLGEAILYQNVLLYDSGSTSGSNLQEATNSINTKTFVGSDGISEFVAKVLDMKFAADLIFDTDDENSMVSATLKDLRAVNNGFGLLAGIPAAMTDHVAKTLDKIDEVAKGLRDGGDANAKDGTKALKGQMTQSFSNSVGKKIGEVVAGVAAGNDALKNDPELAAKVSLSSIDTIPDQTFGSGEEGARAKASLKKDLENMCGAYGSLSDGQDPKTKTPPAACQ